MSTEQNKAVIQRFFHAWNSRRPEAFDDLLAPDVVRHCDATPGVEARSRDQIKEFLKQDTQQGPMGPLPASGRKAQFDFGAVFRIESGKIKEWWVTWDNMKILRSLGHLPGG
jgi:hypothetical protein